SGATTCSNVAPPASGAFSSSGCCSTNDSSSRSEHCAAQPHRSSPDMLLSESNLRDSAHDQGARAVAGTMRAVVCQHAELDVTEPMAVGWHAVRRGEVGKRTVAIVIGCGPVGLSVILLLKAKGVRTVVASDYSPGRRALAEACGADVVIDPARESPFMAVQKRG